MRNARPTESGANGARGAIAVGETTPSDKSVLQHLRRGRTEQIDERCRFSLGGHVSPSRLLGDRHGTTLRRRPLALFHCRKDGFIAAKTDSVSIDGERLRSSQRPTGEAATVLADVVVAAATAGGFTRLAASFV